VLVDDLMPQWDGSRIDHRVLEVTPERAYEATQRADFVQAFSESAVARGLVGLRTMVERAVTTVRRQDSPAEAPAVRLTLSGMSDCGQYVLLGEDPPREVAFGMIDRFWGGETDWVEFEASEFRTFSRPGLGESPATSPSASTEPAGRSPPTKPARRRPTRPRAGRSWATGAWPVRWRDSSCAPSWRLSPARRPSLVREHHPEPDHEQRGGRQRERDPAAAW
jgi:hypothetical protein